MSLRVFAITSLLVALVGGCITASDIDKQLGSWVGKDSDALATAWGAPSGVYQKKDGGRILSYERTDVVTTGPMHFAQTYSRHCRIDFTTAANGKITNANWRGAPDQCDRIIVPSESPAK